jgi:hypothetical protein
MAEGKRKQEAESSDGGDGGGVSTLFASSFSLRFLITKSSHSSSPLPDIFLTVNWAVVLFILFYRKCWPSRDSFFQRAGSVCLITGEQVLSAD